MKRSRGSFFSHVDSEAKAYLLGWIASAEAIRGGVIAVHVPREDDTIVEKLRSLCPDLPLKPVPREKRGAGNIVRFVIASKPVVDDVSGWLDLAGGRKDATPAFPELADELRWAFMRGRFDAEGSIAPVRSEGGDDGGMPQPRCTLRASSARMLEAIESFAAIPSRRRQRPDGVEWAGNNALDFMARLYDGATVFLERKRDRYLDWATWVPALAGDGAYGRALRFKWAKCLPDARPPSKAHASDSGYDLTLIAEGKRQGLVRFFRTGLKVQPAYGWYFDLVPRSSISKTGYILANSVGIIDRSYVGEILVPLLKVDASAPELALPARVVQIIPRPIVHAQMIEVASLDGTRRGAGGFGSTGAGT